MAKSIYLTASEVSSGKSVVGLGILDTVLRRTQKVGVYRPVIIENKKHKEDSLIRLFIDYFNLNQNYEDAYGYSKEDALKLMRSGQWESLLDKIIHDYKLLERRYDFILVIGTDLKKEGQSVDFNMNIDIARNLGTSVLFVGKGDTTSDIDQMISPTSDMAMQFVQEDCKVIGAIINKVPSELAYEALIKLRSSLALKDPFIGIIKNNEIIKSPTIEEIVNQINGKVLMGEKGLSNQVFKYSIAAMRPENYLEKITANSLVITPGDRDDILVTILQAHMSKNYPQIAGILLSTGYKPKKSIIKLVEGLPISVPVISTKENTFETSLKLEYVYSEISTKYPKKIEAALDTFEKCLDTANLDKHIINVDSKSMTPRMFQYLITERARKKKKHLVLPEGTDPRILQATNILLQKDVVSVTLLGKKEAIDKEASKLNISLNQKNLHIIDPINSSLLAPYINKFIELRKHKGVNEAIAKDTMIDASYFGTMMVYCGDADAMVSGSVNTTAHTIRPALQIIKTKEKASIVSSIFFMCMSDRVLVYGDCAINPDPNAQQLAAIAIASATTARSFGIEPLVSLLSYSSGGSGKGADVEKVRDAVEILKDKKVDFPFEGPIQYDAAVDPIVAKQKMPNSKVAGRSNVLIFPDLNTGNNTYKAVQRETGAVAIGPILQGLNKPVNDLSRGCTVTDIINTIIITSLQTE